MNLQDRIELILLNINPTIKPNYSNSVTLSWEVDNIKLSFDIGTDYQFCAGRVSFSCNGNMGGVYTASSETKKFIENKIKNDRVIKDAFKKAKIQSLKREIQSSKSVIKESRKALDYYESRILRNEGWILNHLKELKTLEALNN